MRQGDLSHYASSLQHALKTIRTRWEITEESWKDQVARRFGEEYIEPFVPQVDSTLKAIQRLSAAFARAQEECS